MITNPTVEENVDEKDSSVEETEETGSNETDDQICHTIMGLTTILMMAVLTTVPTCSNRWV